MLAQVATQDDATIEFFNTLNYMTTTLQTHCKQARPTRNHSNIACRNRPPLNCLLPMPQN